MKAVGRPVQSAIRAGSFATHAASKPKGGESKCHANPQEVKVTKLQNGVVVASLENYSPLSRVSILYAAGSRHEPRDNLGITHCLRAASNLSTKRVTAFMIAKQVQQMGANLTCTTHREHVEYSLECLRSDLAPAVSMLNHVATTPVFKPWEVDSLSHKLKLDLELYHQSQEARMIEKIHSAAFRDTLGQSLYMKRNAVGSFTPKALEAFVAARYVPQGATVAGVGVDHDALVHLARKLNFQSGTAGSPETKKAKYHGGEIRTQVKGPFVHAALVTEGVSWSSQDLLSLSLVQLSLGVGPYVKYGTNVASSKVGKAAISASSNPCAATCINLNYTDSGLFGFHVIAGKKDIRKILTAVVSTMGQATKGSISDADLQRAKKQLKSLIGVHYDCSESVLGSIGHQALFTGQVLSAAAVDAAIDKITADDVTKIAKKVMSGKPTFVAVGDLVDTPYMDEIVARI